MLAGTCCTRGCARGLAGYQENVGNATLPQLSQEPRNYVFTACEHLRARDLSAGIVSNGRERYARFLDVEPHAVTPSSRAALICIEEPEGFRRISWRQQVVARQADGRVKNCHFVPDPQRDQNWLVSQRAMK